MTWSRAGQKHQLGLLVLQNLDFMKPKGLNDTEIRRNRVMQEKHAWTRAQSCNRERHRQ